MLRFRIGRRVNATQGKMSPDVEARVTRLVEKADDIIDELADVVVQMAGLLREKLDERDPSA